MSSLPKVFDKIRTKRGLTNAEIAHELCLDPAITSRITNDRIVASHGLIGRMLIKLTADEAREVLQAYFDDELERIRAGRIEKAEELKIRIKSDINFVVRVHRAPGS